MSLTAGTEHPHVDLQLARCGSKVQQHVVHLARINLLDAIWSGMAKQSEGGYFFKNAHASMHEIAQEWSRGCADVTVSPDGSRRRCEISDTTHVVKLRGCKRYGCQDNHASQHHATTRRHLDRPPRFTRLCRPRPLFVCLVHGPDFFIR